MKCHLSTYTIFFLIKNSITVYIFDALNFYVETIF